MKKLVHSVAFKTIAILVISSVMLASIVSFLGDRAGREIAQRGVAAVAETQTLGMAERLLGPIRFKRLEDVEGLLEEAMSRSEFAVDAIVLVQDGTVLQRADADVSDPDLALLTELARRAIETGESVVSESGLKLAVPIRKSADEPVVGAVASFWTSEPFFQTIGEYRKLQVMGAAIALAALALVSGFAIRYMVGRPIGRVELRASEMADGDLRSPVPGLGSKGEIGGLASSMDGLRRSLVDAEIAATNAFYQSAGFESSSSAQLLCDQHFRIASCNAEFTSLLSNIGVETGDLIGNSTDIFGIPSLKEEELKRASLPMHQEFSRKDKTFSVQMKQIHPEDISKGYVFEWRNVTELKVNEGILHALEEGLLRFDFDGNGSYLSSSGHAQALLDGTPLPRIADVINAPPGSGEPNPLSNDQTFFGRFVFCAPQGDRLLDGSINLIKDATGKVSRYVVLGNDVTAAETALSEARRRTEEMTRQQAVVVSQLQAAMRGLSGGALTVRLDEAFAEDYEALRADFNSAVNALDGAIGKVLISTDQIGLDTNAVNQVIGEFAKRTERQAATLEEISAAVYELSASVVSAATGAREARDTVLSASEQAASSSDIVNETVGAMGRIEQSSGKISSIVGVIDDIAFQTNLLALNAGVEAARAGEAGRGFAVVASEVRELAQRSAEAASEISALIGTSDEQVKVGVELVGKTGSALNRIAQSIESAAGKMEAITISAEEQATAVEEVNQAMLSLDQATQQNAAMFEETAASMEELHLQAQTLEGVTSDFDVTAKAGEPVMQQRMAS